MKTEQEGIYKAIGILKNEAGDVVVIYDEVTFKTLDEAEKYINGSGGDEFADYLGDETRNGEKYEGYWVDDILVS
jgi:hypothetical protein